MEHHAKPVEIIVITIFGVAIVGFLVGLLFRGEDDASGKNSDIAAQTDEIRAGITVPYEELARGYYSGYEKDTHFVIETRADWQTLWEKLYASVEPRPPLPFVDFERHIVVAAFTAFDETRNPSLAIESAREYQTEIVVALKELYPGKRCRAERNKLLGKPFIMVKIKKTEKEFVFKRTEIIRDC